MQRWEFGRSRFVGHAGEQRGSAGGRDLFCGKGLERAKVWLLIWHIVSASLMYSRHGGSLLEMSLGDVVG